MRDIETALEKLAESFLPFLNQKEEEYLRRICGFREENRQRFMAYGSG